MQNATQDHKTIQEWIEKNHGILEIVYNPTAEKDKVGIRINLPGPVDDRF